MKIRYLLLLIVLTFSKQIFADSTFVHFQDEWKYFDGGYKPSSVWNHSGYNDTSWPVGYAKLGYGDGDENTVISYGPDASNKYITTYFRKTIIINNPSDFASYHLNLLRDDGAIVYINGNEVFRSNMPASAVSYSTLAFTDAVDDGAVPQTIVLLPTSFQSGANVIAVEVHQYHPASSDLCFDLELIGYNYYVPQLLRQPYLQMVSTDAISVRWRTNVPCYSEIQYGVQADSLIKHIIDSSFVTDHEIRITGLQPEQKYFYAVTDLTTVLQGDTSNYFSTAPVTGKNKHSRIWIMADTGVNTVDQNTVRDAFLTYNNNESLDMLWMLGDNAYMSGTDQEYQDAFFQNHYEDILKNIPLFTIAGNHENYTANALTQTGPYYDIFSLPKNGECGGVASGSEAYYSFDYGNIHVVALEANTPSLRVPGSPMLNWLATDLAATELKWKIILIHNPPYTKGGHDSDTENDLIQIRQNIMPVLEQYKADVILTGHSHVYERTYFINGHYGLSTTFNSTMIVDSSCGAQPMPYLKQTSKDYKGIVMVQAGCSGVVEGVRPDWPHPAMRTYLDAHLGSLLLDINNDTLTVKFIDNTVNSPQVLDEFSIVKRCDVIPHIATSVTKMCIADAPIILQGTPPGGYFAGAGVTDSIFDPSAAGAGMQTLSYTFQDIQGCKVKDSLVVEVINGVPQKPSVTAGSHFVCPPSKGEQLSINAVQGADDYSWSGSYGVYLKNPINDTLINFDLTSVMPIYKIWVSASNFCGNSDVDTILLTSQRNFPLTLTGSPVACPNDTLKYSISPLTSLATSWWSATDGIIVNGNSTPVTVTNQLEVSVAFDSSFAGGKICVANKESCLRNVKASCAEISLKPAMPALITGVDAVLPGTSGVVYQIDAVAGATRYYWSVPANCVIVSGQNTTSVTLDFMQGFSGGIISVKSQSDCDESAASLKLIKTYSLAFSTTYLSPARTWNNNNVGMPLIHIQPNPVKDVMQIVTGDLGNDNPVSIKISDISGKLVMSRTFSSFGKENYFTMNVSGLSSGYYFLSINTDLQTSKVGFIKE